MNRPRVSSSPLTSDLSSAPSSQATFRTASSQPDEGYRQSRELPFELLSYVKFYIEEPMLTTAFRILTSITTSSLTNHDKVYVPPPDYLSVFSTIAVHPSLTSRTNDSEKHSQAVAALKYLNLIAKIVGPTNAKLSTAFRFDKFLTVTRTESSNDFNQLSSKLSTIFATEDNIYKTAEDFWSVVGWALNCSCQPIGSIQFSRWQYWCAWLDHHLMVLESDWQLHTSQDTAHLSILWSYIHTATSGDARTRRILRSIFADASQRSTNEFREVFRKELKRPRSAAEKQRRDEEKASRERVDVDIDEEIYGDYLDSSSSGTDSDEQLPNVIINSDLNPGRANKRRRLRDASHRRRNKHLLGSHETEDSDTSSISKIEQEMTLGPPEAITIRLRLLQLLVNVSSHASLPPQTTRHERHTTFPDLHDLMTLFVENIRPLPLSLFQQFVLPTIHRSGSLSADAQTTLTEFLLQRIMESEASGLNRKSTFEPLTQARLVTEYLPFAAAKNTVEFQVKMSLLCEALLRRLRVTNMLVGSPQLELAVEQGIAKRSARVDEIRSRKSRKGREGDEEEKALKVLERSTARMRLTIEQRSGYADGNGQIALRDTQQPVSNRIG